MCVEIERQMQGKNRWFVLNMRVHELAVVDELKLKLKIVMWRQILEMTMILLHASIGHVDTHLVDVPESSSHVQPTHVIPKRMPRDPSVP